MKNRNTRRMARTFPDHVITCCNTWHPVFITPAGPIPVLQQATQCFFSHKHIHNDLNSGLRTYTGPLR